jgi:rhodanese-related sulfurtransferase
VSFDDPRLTIALAAILVAGMLGGTFLHEEPEGPHPILEKTRDLLRGGLDILITAEELYTEMSDGDPSDDPFILSIRDREDYVFKGHIPGAVNIEWAGVFDEGNLSLLPEDRQIVVVCYYNHQAAQMAALLQLAGFDAVSLKWGMCAWTRDPGQKLSCFDRTYVDNEFPVMPGGEPGNFSLASQGTRGSGCGADEVYPTPPGVKEGEEADTEDIIRDYLHVPRTLVMVADPLFYRLMDNNTSNDPFVLDIRDRALYEGGHVPGAVHVPVTDLFAGSTLRMLPGNETTIVVVSDTEHLAGGATALLNVNGYDAVAMKWGMMAWTTDPAVAPGEFVLQEDGYDHVTVSGEYPGIWE